MDDWQLLAEYATRNSEEAFRTLVDRHAALVYHTALRSVGNAQQAEEITQAVFIALARKVDRIPQRATLAGWLFRATRFAVANQTRSDARRQRHEQEAMLMQSILHPNQSDPDSDPISPHLNDALNKLSEKDREAVLIRFFQNKSHKELAQSLGVTEDAAKMRVSRAVEKLRLIFAKQGIVLPSAVLIGALAACNAQAAPAGLTASVAAAALANGTTATASTVTIAQGILKLMAWAKMKTAIAIGASVVLAASTASVVVNSVNSPAESVVSRLSRQTGKTIVAEKRINLPVTLIVKNLSLEEALDQLAVEAGAYWTVDFAVFDSDRALRQLLAVLEDAAELESAGWTNLSSRPLESAMQVVAYRSGGGMRLGTNSPSNVVGMVVVLDQRASAKRNEDFMRWLQENQSATQNGLPPARQPDAELRNAIGFAMTNGMADGALAPERLLAEKRLLTKINATLPAAATPKMAAEIAKAASAKWTTIYTLRKSPVAGAGIKLIHAGMNTVYGQINLARNTSESDLATRMVERFQQRHVNLSAEERNAHERAVEILKQKQAAAGGNP